MEPESQRSAGNSEEVRRQLKKASIEEEQGKAIPSAEEQAGQSGLSSAMTANGDHTQAEADPRGRLRRKRSHEDVEDEASASTGTSTIGKHARKRSKSGEPDDTMTDKPAGSQDTVEDPSVSDLAASHTQQSSAEATNGSLYQRTETPDQGALDEDKDSLLISPKNKRTRDQYLQTSVANEENNEAEDDGNTASVEGSSKPAKRARDSTSPQLVAADESATAAAASALASATSGEQASTTVPSTSGFANTSATSPFASVASPKSPQTSASAFAQSGFSTFASASASPFAAASPAAGSASPFGALSGKPSLAPAASLDSTSKPGASPFGGVLGASSSSKSPFATTGSSVLGGGTPSGFGSLGGGSTSGFGGLGGGSTGGFGSGFAAVKPSGGLSSFATPGAVGITGLSDKPAKPFGAAVGDDEDGDDDGEDDEHNTEGSESGIKSPPTTLTSEKKDRRFYEQTVATGEEDEITHFSARGKLMAFDEGQWKERGLGALKLNIMRANTDDDDEDKPKTKARLLMRAEGSQRVVLNSPIQKTLLYGNPKGEKPKSTEHFQFIGVNEGKMLTLLVKMKQQNKEDLWDCIEELKKEI